MAATASTRTEQPPPRGEGRGRVLAAAFDEAEKQPALNESRDQALDLVARGAPPHEVADAAETDVGLTCAIVRAAGQLQGGGRIRSVPDAVERLGPGAVEAILRSAPAYDMFSGDTGLALRPDRFRMHALAVQRTADRIAEIVGYSDRDELALAAVLHDIGLTHSVCGDHRFEVNGANAARSFIKERGLSDRRAQLVWNPRIVAT